jgi:hypothetical protein
MPVCNAELKENRKNVHFPSQIERMKLDLQTGQRRSSAEEGHREKTLAP